MFGQNLRDRVKVCECLCSGRSAWLLFPVRTPCVAGYSCGSRRVQQLPALHAFHTAPSTADPLFSWEQRTGRQPSLPVPENRRFRGKGGRVIGPFHIAREAAVACLEGFSGHKAALRPPASLRSELLEAGPGALSGIPGPCPLGARHIPLPPVWQPKVSPSSVECSLWD